MSFLAHMPGLVGGGSSLRTDLPQYFYGEVPLNADSAPNNEFVGLSFNLDGSITPLDLSISPDAYYKTSALNSNLTTTGFGTSDKWLSVVQTGLTPGLGWSIRVNPERVNAFCGSVFSSESYGGVSRTTDANPLPTAMLPILVLSTWIPMAAGKSVMVGLAMSCQDPDSADVNLIVDFSNNGGSSVAGSMYLRARVQDN